MKETSFVGIEVSKRFDTFAGARGEKSARRFEVYGYTFMARKPG